MMTDLRELFYVHRDACDLWDRYVQKARERNKTFERCLASAPNIDTTVLNNILKTWHLTDSRINDIYKNNPVSDDFGTKYAQYRCEIEILWKIRKTLCEMDLKDI